VLDTLVALNEKCFQEPLKAVKTVQISKFICEFQTARPYAWQPYMLSWQRGTVRWFRLADHKQRWPAAASEAGMRWSARYQDAHPCRHWYTYATIWHCLIKQSHGSCDLVWYHQHLRQLNVFCDAKRLRFTFWFSRFINWFTYLLTYFYDLPTVTKQYTLPLLHSGVIMSIYLQCHTIRSCFFLEAGLCI